MWAGGRAAEASEDDEAGRRGCGRRRTCAAEQRACHGRLLIMVRTGLLLILVPFSVIAALMAFLITYEEMRHHHSGRTEPAREAVRAAIFVLLVFLTLSWVVTIVLGRV